MAAPGNPFAVPAPAAAPSPAAGANPFDPMGGSSPAPTQAPAGFAPAAPSPYQQGSPAPNVQQYHQGSPASGMTQSPFQPQQTQPQVYDSSSSMGMPPGTPQATYPPQQQPPQQNGQDSGFGMASPPNMNNQQFYGNQQPTYSPAPPSNPHQMQQFGAQPVQSPASTQPQMGGNPSPAQSAGFDPFAAPPQVPAPAPPSQDFGALVVSQQQSNPYDPFSAPQPQQPPQQSGQYGILATPGGPTAGYGQPPGAPAPQLAGYAPQPGTPTAPPLQQQEQQWGMHPMPPSVPAPPPPQPPQMSHENSLVPVAPGESFPSVEAPAPPPPAQPMYNEQPQPAVQNESRALTTTEGNRPYGGGDGGGNNDRAIAPRKPKPPAENRNKYSEQIARQAPHGASPLPKADLVRKTGYVLSRISFRTIVMKKWKQSFWVQYGSHTMLWFRSQYDFDDWLNNPYHTQGQRNFLIKLAVNFVHDLYKPNVRGYQVTQCRSKPYGTKMVRQFKLERWMDYGPTIAAAFGSYDPNEVDKLREAIVECMRNTPLDGGIRATGAVRHQPNQGGQPNRAESEPRYYQGDGGANNGHGYGSQEPTSGSGAVGHNGFTGNPGGQGPSRSVASAGDLLDDHHNFDDTASYPGATSGALVPAHNPSPAYPGAPPPPPPQQQQAYQAQQQPYGAQPQYGAPPPQQPQYAGQPQYGSQPQYGVQQPTYSAY